MNYGLIIATNQLDLLTRKATPLILAIAVALAVACASGVSTEPLAPTAVVPSATTPTQVSARTAASPPVSVISIDAESLGARAFKYTESLAIDLAPRMSATDHELRSAEFLRDRMAELGYESELQNFEFDYLNQEGDFIHLIGLAESSMNARMIRGSSPGTEEGLLVNIGLGRIQDIPADGLNGAIAFALRGEIPFETKAQNAASAGAAAIIVANSYPDPISAAFSREFEFLAVSVSGLDGDKLRQRIDGGQATVRLDVTPEVLPSRNIVATNRGVSGDIVILGAHFDTVPGSPGAVDNASGVAIVLTIAEEIAGLNLPYELRFVFFGSEELGLFGSQHYLNSLTPEEASRVSLMINLDAVGAGQLELHGDSELVAAAQDIADDLDISVRRGVIPANSSSDHAPFEAAGIPVLMLFGSDFSQIHTPLDAMDTVEPDTLGAASALVVAGLFGGFGGVTSMDKPN
ncbi:MAG: Zn-dependent exopeptidase M28 [Chloroflexi bacterium]|nr:Zn-dependent exopeptidase M28 [Chloroflexota bacterium]